ncbi:hypothetical protein [Phytoactinopolyspora halotolerans]|uniref:Uncharacterized protein n=1 Tax=Phytoactinopolyspora halotolerans TaxID=1981512 RepID=A0A6L9SF84_9ACTN|nr:hypothetical protein [Phytoactinopolyspora halotolerans]NEE03767.1 hypothetical protein [Phytoactinopolyspora halotolerans]
MTSTVSTTVSTRTPAPVQRAYTSVATKDDTLWSVRSEQRPEVTTTAKRLDHAIAEHRRALAELLETSAERLDLVVHPVIPAQARQHLDLARELRRTAARAKAEAATEAKSAARGLAAMEISLRDIGTILGVSHQRAHQLVNDPVDGPTTAART